MESALSQNMLSDDQPLPRFRSELVFTQQVYDSQPYWVYKDPLSLRYYRFNREEHFIIGHLTRGVTLKELKQAHYQEFNGLQLSTQEVGSFISNLLARNLLILKQPDRDEFLYSSAKKKRWMKLFGQITNFLFIKIPLYDPDKLFDRMIPHIRFIWSRTFFLCYLALLMVGALLIIQKWHDFTYMFSTSFFTLYNAPILLAVMWLVKALHEFGHGLTCKNYGGEVHELGFLILVFMPMLYCNITDSWTFRSKAQRILTTAGGIMTELVLAGFAAIVWYFTEPPGIVHAFAFNMVMLCSLSTIIFNANPLLRFDGYYIMMDLIEVPNLRQRASKYMNGLFLRYILGGHPNEMPEEHRYKYIFPFYAVSALIYRCFIVIVIMMGVYKTFEYLHLIWLGRFLVTVLAMTMLAVPIYKGGNVLVKQRSALGISNIRLLVLLALVSVAAGLALFCPLSQHVTLNFILEPAKVQWLRSEVPGTLSWADDLHEGAWLDKGQVAGSLANPELHCEDQILQAQIKTAKMGMDYYNGRNLANQVDLHRERLKILRREHKRLQEQLANQQIKAPFKGQILLLEQDIAKLQNRYAVLGMPVLLLADTNELEAKVWVPEKTWARIFRESELGQHAEMMLYAFSKDKFSGNVSMAGSSRETNMGEFGEKMALSNKVGGEVLTEYDPAVRAEVPMEAVYEVTIRIDKGSLPTAARPYMSGRVRIDCGNYTLFQWGWGSLLRFISPEVRL